MKKHSTRDFNKTTRRPFSPSHDSVVSSGTAFCFFIATKLGVMGGTKWFFDMKGGTHE